METETIVAIVSAALALLSFLGSVVFSVMAASSNKQARAQADLANKFAGGSIETTMRMMISDARKETHEVSLEIVKLLNGRDKKSLDAGEKAQLDILYRIYDSSIENLFNAYEDACGKYRDEKIYKDRFKKMYIKEIEHLCDPKKDSYARLMHPEGTSAYKAIWLVYHEWHTHEK